MTEENKDMIIDNDVDLEIAFRFTVNKNDTSKILSYLNGKDFTEVMNSFFKLDIKDVNIKQKECLTRFRESKKFQIIPLENEEEIK